MVAGLTTSSVLPVPIVDDFQGGTLIVNDDADAAQDADCQRKVTDPAPPAYPLNIQNVLQLH